MNISKKNIIISLILKIIVVICAFCGTFLSAWHVRSEFMGGKYIFFYFTIQSNIFIALICLVGILFMLAKKNHYVMQLIRFIGTVSITLTGMVFCFILAPTLGKAAWNIQNILTHVVVPVSSAADFILTAPYDNLKKKDVFYTLIPPLLYVIFAGIGYVCGLQFSSGANYPYFFLNWGSEAGAFGFSKELPFMGCAWWILILGLFILLCSYIYWAIAAKLRKTKKSEM